MWTGHRNAPARNGDESWRAARRAALALVVAAAANAGANSSHGDDPLTPQERRGKDIYFGTTREQPSTITARVGDPPTEVPAAVMACVNCHGADGRGSREGAVAASDITWDALTKPYGVTHPGGRTHPPYTERLLLRAIGMGIDPAGQRLHPAMPRFQMSHADAAALARYLKALASQPSTGVTEREIRIGTVVPAAGTFAEAGRAAAAALSAYVDTLNEQGGIYGRRLNLHVVPVGPDDAASTIERFVRDAAPLAMVGGVLAGLEPDVIPSIEALGVPFVGPLTMFPDPSAVHRTTFYLLSGVEQQARALVDFNRADPGATVAIVHGPRQVPREVVERIRAHAARSGSTVTVVEADGERADATAIATRLLARSPARVLVLSDGRTMPELAGAMAAAEPMPMWLVPGSLATDDVARLPSRVLDRTFIALPSVPADQSPAGLEEYRALANAHRLPATEMAWQLATLAAAKVLTQGLKNAGRAVDRARLVGAIEQLSDFDSGLMPRLRFGRAQRLGAAGVYIVTLDPERKQFRQVTGWLPVN